MPFSSPWFPPPLPLSLSLVASGAVTLPGAKQPRLAIVCGTREPRSAGLERVGDAKKIRGLGERYSAPTQPLLGEGGLRQSRCCDRSQVSFGFQAVWSRTGDWAKCVLSCVPIENRRAHRVCSGATRYQRSSSPSPVVIQHSRSTQCSLSSVFVALVCGADCVYGYSLGAVVFNRFFVPQPQSISF